jgi:hypothetical protein
MAVAWMERQRRAIRVHASTDQPMSRISLALHPGYACLVEDQPTRLIDGDAALDQVVGEAASRWSLSAELFIKT